MILAPFGTSGEIPLGFCGVKLGKKAGSIAVGVIGLPSFASGISLGYGLNGNGTDGLIIGELAGVLAGALMVAELPPLAVGALTTVTGAGTETGAGI